MASSAWTPVDEKAQAWTPVPEPSAGDRFMGSSGLTSGGRSLPQQVGYEASTAYHHPIETAKETVTAPVTGYAQAAADQAQRVSQHWQRARSTGDPRDYLDAAAHGLYYLLTPVGGANLGRAADQSAQGDLAGAAGSMLMPTAGLAAGSPVVRSGVGTAVNAARTGTAAAVDAAAKPVANIATAAGTISELAQGRPITAGIVAAKGKPYIASGMNSIADLIRPGQAPIEMMPLTRQLLGNPVLRDFLSSPGLQDEIDARTNQNIQADAAASQFSPAPYRLSGNKITDAATATPKTITPVGRQLGTGAPPAATPSMPAINVQQLMQAASDANKNANFPRTLSGESVLNQALTALDNKTLIKVARSRGINITKEALLKPGTADNLIIKKIIDDFSPEELSNVRDTGAEVSRFKPVQPEGVTPEAGKEAWHYKVLQTYFPDVKIPQAMATRAQQTIGMRPDAAPTLTDYANLAKKAMGKDATASQIMNVGQALKAQDENMAAILQESIDKVNKQKQSAMPAQSGSAAGLPKDFSIVPDEQVNGTNLSMRDAGGKEIGSVGLKDTKIGAKSASEVGDIQVQNKGQGYGQALYQKAAEHAAANGDDFLVSSGKPSPEALAAWKRIMQANPQDVRYINGRFMWKLDKFKVKTGT